MHATKRRNSHQPPVCSNRYHCLLTQSIERIEKIHWNYRGAIPVVITSLTFQRKRSCLIPHANLQVQPVQTAATRAGTAQTNAKWWPEQINLKIFHQHSSLSNPLDAAFGYSREFETLDLDVVVKDLRELMADSGDWWPADYVYYDSVFIRVVRHSVGTYRISDGRGGGGNGAQRFAPDQ